ncbi:phosphotransferase enzyme family-domain-containing protein [Peziza echinospora]|nr:phosphotransferase enzyme family-domain-containing protein [Peziza echinospora]
MTATSAAELASRRYGLRWTNNLWGPQPEWACEPDVDAIRAIAARHVSEPAVALLGGGAFNKLYTVTSSSHADLVFRVTLPVEPRYKTASEVATIRYIARRTHIPLPAIIAYDCTADNELLFEWILMEKMPGVCYAAAAQGLAMPMECKQAVARAVAGHVLEMRKTCLFSKIGSLYQRCDLTEAELAAAAPTELEDTVLGPAVTMCMFLGPLKMLITRDRGPYRTDHDYVSAQLNAQIEDNKLLRAIAAGDDAGAPYDPSDHGDDGYDSDTAEDAAEAAEGLQALRSVLPSIFATAGPPPSSQVSIPPFVLRHQDLNHSNILLDPATYAITGIVDWECTISGPKWEDTYPAFIDGTDRLEQPPQPNAGDGDGLRMEQWDEWEKTQLRRAFDQVAGAMPNEDYEAEVKRIYLMQMNSVGLSGRMVVAWVEKLKQVINRGWQGIGELLHN